MVVGTVGLKNKQYQKVLQKPKWPWAMNKNFQNYILAALKFIF